ncbi:MAG TPA: peptide chain release factor N(5)-glutamine methyltransferase [Thermoanaerobaculia bacterium]|nr:peptide chain release factor N(5)-glutamine methyltransferase [Thermoanaerobaculia bacterium]
MSPTLGDLLAAARQRLAATPFGAPPREAALLLGHVLGLSEAQLLARDREPAPPPAAARFESLLARRLTGEPVAYLTGTREFWGRAFRVDRRVLIPRPETEHVVEAALAEPLPQRPRLLDVGTGSGCLAITLALEIPAARLVAADLSPGALAVAAANARELGAAGRVAFLAGDLAAGIDLTAFDLVVSNPPYIDPAELPGLSPEVCAFEPRLALSPRGAGDLLLARLLQQATGLRRGARLIVEIGARQRDAVVRHGAVAGLSLAAERADYAGIPRVLVFERS